MCIKAVMAMRPSNKSTEPGEGGDEVLNGLGAEKAAGGRDGNERDMLLAPGDYCMVCGIGHTNLPVAGSLGSFSGARGGAPFRFPLVLDEHYHRRIVQFREHYSHWLLERHSGAFFDVWAASCDELEISKKPAQCWPALGGQQLLSARMPGASERARQ